MEFTLPPFTSLFSSFLRQQFSYGLWHISAENKGEEEMITFCTILNILPSNVDFKLFPLEPGARSRCPEAFARLLRVLPGEERP